MKESEQAQHALDYLHLCNDITLGCGEFKGRELEPLETQVKERALRQLSIYYQATPQREELPKPKSARRKKKSKAHRTP